MRTFTGLNTSGGACCFICGTQDEGEVVLVAVDGTREGNIEQAKQAHLGCIDLRLAPGVGLLYQNVGIVAEEK